MRFLNAEHEKFYESCLARSKRKDCYEKALFYVLGLTEDCRNNIDGLYDWEDFCVKPVDGKGYGWITGTDMRIIRLAYNLYNGGAPTAFYLENQDEKTDELKEYLPTSLFGYLDKRLIEFCLEGIRIRYEME